LSHAAPPRVEGDCCGHDQRDRREPGAFKSRPALYFRVLVNSSAIKYSYGQLSTSSRLMRRLSQVLPLRGVIRMQ